MNKNDLLKLTLDVYEEECKYLKELELDVDNQQSFGYFSVPSTCYAVKGRKYHLNAAEVVITYEQIMYATLSNVLINGLYHLEPVDVDYFFPTIVDEKTLIVKFNTRFYKQVNNHSFRGVFLIKKIISRTGKKFFYTEFNIEEGAQIADVIICIES
ncbi:FcoT family thioesterase [Moorena sp. SIO3H5]|uniref:FcoT family thioesterase n=1 Tax=Moorena sp. SIO3H5 TaxID=2607834 RepID=UPI0013B7BD06|nr:FcoT family thioesterase [Moorena sp. SIO3H5]NEO68851.1 hypothetical protein [Moorena sp. SIO3H5]